jgi:hypothetical protein
MNRRRARVGIAVAFGVLAALAVLGAALAATDPQWRPFPPEIMLAAGATLALLSGAWLWSADHSSLWSTGLVLVGGVMGVLVGLFGVSGTLQIWNDFCSVTGATAALASSIPGGVSCADIGDSLLVGGYLIAIGIVSLVSLGAVARRDPETT